MIASHTLLFRRTALISRIKINYHYYYLQYSKNFDEMPQIPHNGIMLKEHNNNISTNIIKIGADVLSRKAQVIQDVQSPQMQKLIRTMFDTMRQECGVGLAAPQINISKQIAVIETDGQQYVLINPKIIARSDDMIIFKEGCLSVPDKELEIFRHQKITIQYIDENGINTRLKAEDFLAVVCQHEIDHLNGVLMTDRYAQQKNLRQTFNIALEQL